MIQKNTYFKNYYLLISKRFKLSQTCWHNILNCHWDICCVIYAFWVSLQLRMPTTFWWIGWKNSHNSKVMNFSYRGRVMQVRWTLSWTLFLAQINIDRLCLLPEATFIVLFAGHYVPQLAELVYDRNKRRKTYPFINLKGFIVRLTFILGLFSYILQIVWLRQEIWAWFVGSSKYLVLKYLMIFR